MSTERAREFTLALSEVASNSVLHGGGRGTLRLWRQASELVCEVTDAGVITDPMVGRIRPAGDQLGGRGLWFVNQLRDVTTALADTRAGELIDTAHRDGITDLQITTSSNTNTASTCAAATHAHSSGPCHQPASYKA